MKKKLLTILILGVLVLGLSGCGNNKESAKPNDNKEETRITEKTNAIDSNDNYFVMIKGTKFKAGDKIANLSQVGLSQDSRAVDEKVPKNTYLIGAGGIYNSNNKRLFNLLVFNPGNTEISVKDAVIGGIDIGEAQYSRVSSEVLELGIEVAGGIKLGSTLEDIEKVFGKTDDIYEATSVGYTKYTYKSSDTYRYYEFTVDSEGKVSEIYWKNFSYNR